MDTSGRMLDAAMDADLHFVGYHRGEWHHLDLGTAEVQRIRRKSTAGNVPILPLSCPETAPCMRLD